MIPPTASETIDDESLARQARDGDAAAMETLVRRWQIPLMRFLERRVGRRGDAEDLFQESFIRVCRGLGAYDARRPFKTWLYTIAWRLAANHLRDRHDHAGETALGSVRSPVAAPDQRAQDADERQSLWGIARRVLRDEQYQLLWLCYAEGFSPREVGEITGKSWVATKTALHRARKCLEPHLMQRNMP